MSDRTRLLTGRRTGKTTRLIRESLRTGKPILVVSRADRDMVYQLAKKAGLPNPSVYTARGLKSNPIEGYSGILIDDVGRVLEVLTGCSIDIVTIGVESSNGAFALMEKGTITYGDGVSIGGVKLTPSNITNFGLYVRYSSEIADIYSTEKRSIYGRFIIHVKDQKRYVKGNRYLEEKRFVEPEIDWFECSKNSDMGLEENIDYIKERL